MITLKKDANDHQIHIYKQRVPGHRGHIRPLWQPLPLPRALHKKSCVSLRPSTSPAQKPPDYSFAFLTYSNNHSKKCAKNLVVKITTFFAIISIDTLYVVSYTRARH